MKRIEKIEKYLPWIGTLLLGICTWLFWTFIHPETLAYQEEMQMFLFDSEYLVERVVLPAGVARYVAEFLTQFYNYVNIGAAVIALLFVALQQCVWQLAKKQCKSKAWYWVSFWPVLLLLSCMGIQNIKLTLAVSILFAMVAILCYPANRSNNVKGIYAAIVTPLLYWCAGPCVLIFALFVLVLSITQKRVLFGAVSAIYAFVLILASASFVPQPLFRLFYGIGYSLNIIELPPLQCIAMVAFAVVPIMISYLPAIKVEQNENGLYGGCFGVTFGFGVLIAPLFFDSAESSALKYDMYVRGQKWDKIISMARDKNPDLPTTVASLNLALGMKGELSGSGMSFFQHGWQGAFPQFNRNCLVSICLSEICYHVGFVNSAQRFAFEANEAIPDNNKSARLTKRLAETNIVNGQYEVARKYLLLLQKTIYYRHWATETLTLLGDEDAINNHPYYGYMRKVHLTDDMLFSDVEIDKMMGQLVMRNKDNGLAIQYLLFLPQLEGNQQKYMMYLDYVQKRLQGENEVSSDSVSVDSVSSDSVSLESVN